MKFYKDGLEIYDGEKASIIKGPGGVFYLIFRSLSVENSGEIKCVAFSDAGESVSVAKLQVEGKCIIILLFVIHAVYKIKLWNKVKEKKLFLIQNIKSCTSVYLIRFGL